MSRSKAYLLDNYLSPLSCDAKPAYLGSSPQSPEIIEIISTVFCYFTCDVVDSARCQGPECLDQWSGPEA